MNKRLSVFLIITLLSLPLLFSSSISFSGGESRLVMREGEKSVTLKSGAEVTTGSLYIKAEEMSLSGDDWKTISAKGDISVTDSENSPIAQFATHLLLARSSMVSFVDSLVAPLSLINALIAAAASEKSGEVYSNLSSLENIWDEYQIYQTHEDE